jgi:hypothetical protein
MWTKDYLIRGFVRRNRAKKGWSAARLRYENDKKQAAYLEEWQALYRVEGARRRLKAARAEAREIFTFNEVQTRIAVERAEAERRNAELKQRWLLEQPKREARKAAERAKELAEVERLQRLARDGMPARAEWLAWAWGTGKKHREIAAHFGKSVGGSSPFISRYFYAYAPPECLFVRDRMYWRYGAEWGRLDSLYSVDRREVLRQHFEGKPEPPRPEGWREILPERRDCPPAPGWPRTPGTEEAMKAASRARYQWAWERRTDGWTLEEIGDGLNVSRERIRQMLHKEERRRSYRVRGSFVWYWYLGRDNLGRPIDMGGPRDVWLTYELDNPKP